MATVNPTKAVTDRGDLVLTWADVTEADAFGRFNFEEVVSEVSVHIHGTFGGATVAIKGSNHDDEGTTLSRIDGTVAEATSEAIFSLLDRSLYIQPTHSGGSSETVTVTALVKR